MRNAEASQIRLSGVVPPRRTFRDRVFSSSLYSRSLKNRTPKRFLFTPVDAIAGQKDRADTLFQGNFLLQGVSSKFKQAEPWFTKGLPLYWHQELHRFNWLRDFSANDSDAARRHSRALLLSWIKEFEGYQPHIWDPYILARRLINWMQQSAFLLTKNDGDFNYKFIQSLRIQLQHLKHYCRYFSKEADQFELYLALYLGSACFTDTQRDAGRLEEQLLIEIDKVILPDGSHISRNPSQHLTALADLMALSATYTNTNMLSPVPLTAAIERLTSAVRFFQHGDGALALFNGGYSLDEATCSQVLSLSEKPALLTLPPVQLTQAGFARLAEGSATLIVETARNDKKINTPAYIGIGSFEFSHDKNRLIVNCGAHPDESSDWSSALAQTAAHSTLCISDRNIKSSGAEKGKDLDPAPITLHEEGGNHWLEFENLGYDASINIKHTRSLFLGSTGQSLKGEDTVQAPNNRQEAIDFCLRFHLHPELSVSNSVGGRSILMLTKDGAAWTFMTSLSEVFLEESVYCAQAGEVRNTKQIVLRGRLNNSDPLVIKWALHQNTDKVSD